MKTSERVFGWQVVAAVFVIASITWGVGLYGITTLLAALNQSRGWSTASLSAAVSLHYLTSAVLVLGLVRAHAALGIARVTQIGAVILGLGIVLWGHAQAPWQLAIAALLTGSGWSATGTTAIIAMVSAWFDADRAKALGVAMNGISVGGLLFAPVWPALIGQLGIAQAANVAALTSVVVICGLAQVFLTRRGPYAPRPRGGSTGTEAREAKSRIVSTWKFQSVALSFALSLLAVMGIFIHLTAYLSELWGLVSAGLAIGLVTLSTVTGRLAFGWFLQSIGLRTAAVLCFLLTGFAAVLLTLSGVPAFVLAGCAMFGLGAGGLNLLPPLIAQREYAAEMTPTVVGLFGFANQIALTAAPITMGGLSTLFGAYRGPFLLAAAMQVIATLLIASYRERAAAV